MMLLNLLSPHARAVTVHAQAAARRRAALDRAEAARQAARVAHKAALDSKRPVPSDELVDDAARAAAIRRWISAKLVGDREPLKPGTIFPDTDGKAAANKRGSKLNKLAEDRWLSKPVKGQPQSAYLYEYSKPQHKPGGYEKVRMMAPTSHFIAALDKRTRTQAGALAGPVGQPRLAKPQSKVVHYVHADAHVTAFYEAVERESRRLARIRR